MTPVRVLAVTLVTLFAVGPARVHAWPTLLPDTPDNGRPFAIMGTPSGDVVVAGRVAVDAADDDGIIAMLGSADGAILWQHTIDGTAPAGAGGEDLATEAVRGIALLDGDVVAAGVAVDDTTGPDMLVTRRAGADGSIVWQTGIDGGAALNDSGLAVGLGSGGDALVAGTLTPAAATTARAAIVRLGAATGVEAWRVVLDDDGSVARTLETNGVGDVFVAGDVGTTWFVTKRQGADGAEIWRTDLPGDPGNATLRALALRPGGGCVVAGRLSAAATGQDFTVIALGPDGAEQWRYTLDGTAVGAADDDDAVSLAVDAAGDVVAAGQVSDTVTGDDLVVVKLDGTSGAERWRVVVNGSNDNNDEASAVAIDPAGDVAVVGGTRNSGSGRDFTVLLLDGADGTERWRRLIDGATGQADVGQVGATTAEGAVLAAGRTRNGPTADGFTVLKLAGATGGDFPCGTGTIESGEACDDANGEIGDGCRPDCTIEACGDGIRDPGEECDDGNTVDGDCCDTACAVEADASVCDDGDACTLDDACHTGACVGTAVVCEPINQCNSAACDPLTGLCIDTPLVNGRLCDDGDQCTVLDSCQAGTCTAGLDLTCNDFDPCTADGCDAATGCAFAAFTGFEGVTCALDPERVATLCFTGVPRAIDRDLGRMAKRLAKAAAAGDAGKVGRARRLLKRICGSGKKVAKRATKAGEKGSLSVACTAALVEVGTDTCARAILLRDELGAQS